MNIGMMMKLLSKRKQLQKQEHWTRQQLEVYQAQTLSSLRQYAYAHSPFYQQFHKGLYKAPLQELPVLTKAMVMEHFDDLVTDRAGTFGDKLLVTILGNRVQPLIRYELEDSLRLSIHQCTCGRPFTLIDDIQGRVWDILSFPGVSGEDVNVHPIVFFSIMDTLPVSGWQVLQEADGLHLLLSGVHGILDEAGLANTVRQALAKQGAVIPHVEVRQVPSIPQAASGKTPLVKSNLPRTLS